MRKLISTISGRNGLAKANRFSISFSPRVNTSLLIDEIDILCESCSFPGKQIMTNEYTSVKKSEKIVYNYLVDDVTFVFHLTGDYAIKKMFEDWANYIVDSRRFRKEYNNMFVTDVKINQLDNYDKIIYSVTLMNAYPTTINSIELSNTSENQSQRLTVTMTYEDYFENRLNVATNEPISISPEQEAALRAAPQGNTKIKRTSAYGAETVQIITTNPDGTVTTEVRTNYGNNTITTTSPFSGGG